MSISWWKIKYFSNGGKKNKRLPVGVTNRVQKIWHVTIKIFQKMI